MDCSSHAHCVESVDDMKGKWFVQTEDKTPENCILGTLYSSSVESSLLEFHRLTSILIAIVATKI